MKKLMFIAAACVALASCVKNEEAPILVDESPIGFQTVIGLEGTRADGPKDALVAGTDTFMASAFLQNEGETWPNNAKQYFVNQDVAWRWVSSLGASSWTTNPLFYWPAKGSLTFFAHYPAENIAKFNGIDYVFADYNVDTKKNVDLMVADVVANKMANKVPVTFRHKLTRIAISAIKMDATDVPNRTVTLTSVKLTNLNNQGTLTQDGATGATAWSDRSGAKTYELLPVGGQVVTAYGTQTPQAITTDQIFFLPQDFVSENAKIVITYTVTTPVAGGSGNSIETVVKESPLSAHGNFGMNCWYTFNLQIGAAQPIIWEQPAVDGWATATFNIAI